MADQVEKAPVARTESAHSLDQTSQKNLKMDDAAPVAFTKASDEVTIGVGDTDEGKPQQFSGMGKDELMRLSADPFWVRLRWALFILFWLAWFGMLAGAIAIIGTVVAGPLFCRTGPLTFTALSQCWRPSARLRSRCSTGRSSRSTKSAPDLSKTLTGMVSGT